MRPSDTGKLPYVARVEKIEADNRNNVKVRVRWYYRPEESMGGRRQFHGVKEIFFLIIMMCRALILSRGSVSSTYLRTIQSLRMWVQSIIIVSLSSRLLLEGLHPIELQCFASARCRIIQMMLWCSVRRARTGKI